MKRIETEWYEEHSESVEVSIKDDSVRKIRQKALDEAAELVLKTSTLPTFEWLANKIRKLDE